MKTQLTIKTVQLRQAEGMDTSVYTDCILALAPDGETELISKKNYQSNADRYGLMYVCDVRVYHPNVMVGTWAEIMGDWRIIATEKALEAGFLREYESFYGCPMYEIAEP